MSDPWLTAAYEVDGWRCPTCTYSQPQPGPASKHGTFDVIVGEFSWCPGSGRNTTRIPVTERQHR
jgi:hypothetical protein